MIPNDFLDLLRSPPEKMCKLYRTRLKAGLISFLEISESGLKKDLSGVINKIAKLDPCKKLVSEIYFLYFNLRNGVEESNLYQVLGIIKVLEEKELNEFYSRSISIASILHEPWEFLKISTIKSNDFAYNASDVTLEPVDDKALHPIKLKIEQSIHFISKNSNELAQEVYEYVTSVKIFKGTPLVGMSSVEMFGSILLRFPDINIRNRYKDLLIYFCENIIHEMAHYHLNILESYDKLVTNSSKEVYKAPFRSDFRPMRGILHAFFVLAKLIKFFKKISEVSVYKKLFYPHLIEFITKYNETYKIIHNDAKLTDCGKLIIDYLIESQAPQD